MSKITSFDKSNLANVRQDIDNALKVVGEKYGMSVRLGNIRFTQNSFGAKLEANLHNAQTGEVETAEQKELRNLGKMYFGQEFDMDKTYVYMGKPIKFWGIAQRRSKYPVIYTDVNSGKRYKTSLDVTHQIINPNVFSKKA